MCLFPGMMQPVVEPTPKAEQFKKLLCLIAIFHMIFAIMICVFDAYYGFTELLSAMILSCGAAQMHFCYLIFYIILVINSFVIYLSNVGLVI